MELSLKENELGEVYFVISTGTDDLVKRLGKITLQILPTLLGISEIASTLDAPVHKGKLPKLETNSKTSSTVFFITISA